MASSSSQSRDNDKREGKKGAQPYTCHFKREERSGGELRRVKSEPCIVIERALSPAANAAHVALDMGSPLISFSPSLSVLGHRTTTNYACTTRRTTTTTLSKATLDHNVETPTLERNLEPPANEGVVDAIGLGGFLDSGAPWVLAGVTVLWGSQHAVMKQAVINGASPGGLTAARFAIASIFLSPWLRSITKQELSAGIELGIWSFAGFALQTMGLETTTAARSCFLLYLNVKMVPLIGLLTGKPPPYSAWLAAAIALGGTYLLAGDGGMHWAVGDTLSVAAAAASAMFIVRLGSFASSCRPAPLSAVTVAITAILGTVWAFTTGESQIPINVLPAALYLGAIPTALATVLQARAQRVVRPDRAAVIYALDPVYGALFAHWLLGEAFGVQGVAGAALIVLAAFVSNAAAGGSEEDSSGKKSDGHSYDEVRNE